ncbi:hypothetical protein HZA33_01920 [Candidatus Pacearchaeota archaeon]|nr:hypothetical protein [Candidatus Pacearchaeota archaeon]
MNLEELRTRLKKFDLSEIKPTKHAFDRIQDKRRSITYPQIISLLTSQDKLYRFQEQPSKSQDELKFKLWFKLNYIFDINIYIVMNKTEKEKGLNSLKIITAHKVKKDIQNKIERK